MTADGVDRFFAFARARHQITLARRAGLPRPWTDDPILQTYRFTNVFREMDRTTKWIAEHVRAPLDDMLARGEIEPWQQVLGIVLAREFNRIATLERIFCQERIMGEPIALAYLRSARSDSVRDVTIVDLEYYMRRNCQKPWVTGAYIVKTPNGMDKLAGALWMVERARLRLPELAADRSFACSMQALHADLERFPYLGGFTAYEVVTDLRWMTIGRHWPDIMTWACAGPGAIRGLHRVHGRDHGRGLSQPQALAEMRDLLVASRGPRFWPYWTVDDNLLGPDLSHEWPSHLRDRDAWPTWEMREVEHTLCEFDKMERVRLGQGRPRGVYR